MTLPPLYRPITLHTGRRAAANRMPSKVAPREGTRALTYARSSACPTVKYTCHRVAVMYLGQVVESGAKEQVFDTPLHPYSQALPGAHLFPDLDRRRVDCARAPGLAGEIPSPIDLPTGCYLAGGCPRQLDRCAREPQDLTLLPDGRAVRCWHVAGEAATQSLEMEALA